MSSTAILALIAAIAVVATGGIVIAASGYQQWHGPGGMMGGWPSGNGMMGGDYEYGDADGYACPMHEGSNLSYNGTAGMPCWGANQTWNASSYASACWGPQYCWNSTWDQNLSDPVQYCQNYTACPGLAYGMQYCWNSTTSSNDVPISTTPQTDGRYCH